MCVFNSLRSSISTDISMYAMIREVKYSNSYRIIEMSPFHSSLQTLLSSDPASSYNTPDRALTNRRSFISTLKSFFSSRISTQAEIDIQSAVFSRYDGSVVSIVCENERQKDILNELSRDLIIGIAKIRDLKNFTSQYETFKTVCDIINSRLVNESDKNTLAVFHILITPEIMLRLADIDLNSYISFLKPIFNRCSRQLTSVDSFEKYRMKIYGNLVSSSPNDYDNYYRYKTKNPANIGEIISNFMTVRQSMQKE